MSHLATVLLALTVLSVLLSLASNRIMALVKIMAMQGIVVSLLPLTHKDMGGAALALLLITISIKGLIIPFSIALAVRKTKIQREVEPIIGYHASLFAGLFFILLATYIADHLKTSLPGGHVMLIVTAITTLASGLFLLMARRKAITQVIGYLLMENGIYLFGTLLAQQTQGQYLVEFGVLLDLLVGIMIMGIILHNINHTYDDVDTALLGQLKD